MPVCEFKETTLGSLLLQQVKENTINTTNIRVKIEYILFFILPPID
jgi:hypothetical protein